MKSEHGPPATLGSSAAAQVRLIVWCKEIVGIRSSPTPLRWLRNTARQRRCSIGATGSSAPNAAAGTLISSSPERGDSDGYGSRFLGRLTGVRGLPQIGLLSLGAGRSNVGEPVVNKSFPSTEAVATLPWDMVIM